MSLPIRSLPRSFLRSYGTVQGSSVLSSQTQIPLTLTDATGATAPRTTWTRDEVKQIYETPLNQLTYAAVSQLELWLQDELTTLGCRAPSLP
jgi:biotin synthase